MRKFVLPIIAVALLFGGLAVSSADARGCGYGSFYSPSWHGGGGHWYGHGGHAWHDTSHYDYHPGGFYRHGNHFDYVPGHYHWHNTGHWDHFHW